MPQPHPWFECSPVILVLPGGQPPTKDQLGFTPIQRLWASMDDAQHHRFHKYFCEDDRSPATLTLVHWMRDQLKEDS